MGLEHSAVSKEKTKMSQSIREHSSHLGFPTFSLSFRGYNRTVATGVGSRKGTTTPLDICSYPNCGIVLIIVETSFQKLIMFSRFFSSPEPRAQNGCPGLSLADTFPTSFLKPLNGIRRTYLPCRWNSHCFHITCYNVIICNNLYILCLCVCWYCLKASWKKSVTLNE